MHTKHSQDVPHH